MQYLLDTVTIIRHFTGNKNIGASAKKILDCSDEVKFYISAISLMEIMYLAEKKRINIDLKDTLERIRKSSLYYIVDLTPQIIEAAVEIDFYELHDRMILATAKWLDIPIISSDSKFKSVTGIVSIWD
ncbi:MAG: type II toxin-antitoxin system VapC family toxin [Candidatus Delongbacteria bacterium]